MPIRNPFSVFKFMVRKRSGVVRRENQTVSWLARLHGPYSWKTGLSWNILLHKLIICIIKRIFKMRYGKWHFCIFRFATQTFYVLIHIDCHYTSFKFSYFIHMQHIVSCTMLHSLCTKRCAFIFGQFSMHMKKLTKNHICDFHFFLSLEIEIEWIK